MRTLVVRMLLVMGCGCGGGTSEVSVDSGSGGGDTWTATAIPVGAPLDVWVFAQDDVWIAGQRGIAHWDGVEATLVATGAPPDTAFLALWGNAPDDLWAVGGASYLAHYDGATWSLRSGTELAIQLPRSVYADSTTVWVGGREESGALVDTTWTTFPVGASDLWGMDGVIFSGGHRFADGQWSPLSGAPSGTARVWGVARDDVWIATNDSSIARCSSEGCTSTPLELGSYATASGVFGRAADDVYAVGYRRTIAHYDGSAWQVVLQEPTTSTTQLHTIHGSSDGTLWAIGVVGAGNPIALRNR